MLRDKLRTSKNRALFFLTIFKYDCRMVRMKRRYLENVINEFCFADHKMAFVSGPRQCGKTTFAKMLLKDRKSESYFNWDNLAFRRLWTKEPNAIPISLQASHGQKQQNLTN